MYRRLEAARCAGPEWLAVMDGPDESASRIASWTG